MDLLPSDAGRRTRHAAGAGSSRLCSWLRFASVACTSPLHAESVSAHRAKQCRSG